MYRKPRQPIGILYVDKAGNIQLASGSGTDANLRHLQNLLRQYTGE
jgi:hypothetical protein